MGLQTEVTPLLVPDCHTWLDNGEKYYRAGCPKGKESLVPDPPSRHLLLGCFRSLVPTEYAFGGFGANQDIELSTNTC
jgi:hypothetical protein